MHYHVSDTSVPWFSLFETMQEAKSHMGFIQDYSLGETTLEEVFLFFAQKQKTEDNKLEEDSVDSESLA